MKRESQGARLPDENDVRDAMTGLYLVFKSFQTKQRVLEDWLESQARQIKALQGEVQTLQKLLAHWGGEGDDTLGGAA